MPSSLYFLAIVVLDAIFVTPQIKNDGVTPLFNDELGELGRLNSPNNATFPKGLWLNNLILAIPRYHDHTEPPSRRSLYTLHHEAHIAHL